MTYPMLPPGPTPPVLPEGACITDLYIYPMSENPQATDTADKRKLLNFAYIAHKQPCPSCVVEIMMLGLRPEDWFYDCVTCGNYIIFTQINKLVRSLRCKGGSLQDFWNSYDLHYRQKSSYYIPKWSVILKPKDKKKCPDGKTDT